MEAEVIGLSDELAKLMGEQKPKFNGLKCIDHLENAREELIKLGEEFPGEIKVTLDYEYEGIENE